MITTVTSTTVTTTTTVTTMLGLGAFLGIVGIVALVVFLCARELAAASEGKGRGFLAKSLDVAIVPLTLAFVMMVAMKVVAIFG